MLSVERYVGDVIADLFAEREVVPCSRWAPEHVFLDRQMTSRPGPYRLEFSPYWAQLMDFPLQSGFDRLVIQKSSRVGATEAALNILRWMPHHHPGNAIFAIDSQREVKEVNDVRLAPMLRDLGAEHVVDPRDVGKLLIKLRNMIIYLGGGGAAGLFENKWARLVVIDEAENHDLNKDPEGNETSVKLGEQRIKDTPDGKIIVMGKPGERGGIIDREFRTGTMERYHVPCPHCGELFVITLDKLNFGGKDTTDRWDLARVEDCTFLPCPSCKNAIHWDEHLPGMVNDSTACWVPGTESPASPRTRSMQISDLYSQDSKCAWGTIAREFLEAKAEGGAAMSTFFTGRLGECAPVKAVTIDDEALLDCRAGLFDKRLQQRAGVGYVLGWVPEDRYCPVVHGVHYITWCWDVQDKSFKGVCLAMMHSGERYLIDYAEVIDESDVIESYFRRYPLGNKDAEESVETYGGLIDCGDGVRAREVEDLCCRLQDLEKDVFPSKGGNATSGKLWAQRNSRQFEERYRYDYWDLALTRDVLRRLRERKDRRIYMPSDIADHEALAAEIQGVKISWRRTRLGAKIPYIDDRKPHDYFDAMKLCDLTEPIIAAAEAAVEGA